MLWNTAPIYAPHFPHYASKKFSLQYSINATSYRALKCLPSCLKIQETPLHTCCPGFTDAGLLLA